MKQKIILLLLLLTCGTLQAQSALHWEIIGGANYSTINHIVNEQQVTLGWRRNSPGYQFYPQLGFQLRQQLRDRVFFTYGLKYQRKGDLLGTQTLFPDVKTFSNYSDYVTIPLNAEVQIIPKQPFFWIVGLSGGMIFNHSESSLSVPFIEKFSDRLELAAQTGLRMNINKHLAAQVLLSKGLTYTNVVPYIDGVVQRKFQNMQIECALIYSFTHKSEQQ